MFGLGIPELAIIGAVIFLLFGGTMMKNFFSGLTSAIVESKKTLNELKKEIENE